MPAYAAAGISFGSILCTYFLLPETQHARDPNRKSGIAAYGRVLDYLSIASLRRLLLIFLFFTLPFSLYVSMFALYADYELRFTAEQTGYFRGFVGLLGVIWQGGVVGPAVRHLGEHRTMIFGLAASAIGLFYVAWVDVWWKLAFVALFFSLGNSITRPSLTSLVTQAAPPDRRGAVLGATSSIESFSRIVAPIFGGWIIGGLHPTWLGWIGGSLFVVALVIALTDSHGT